MTRDKRPPELRAEAHPVKIRWAARLPMPLLQKLYESDAAGIRDEELCDNVGTYLFARCRTFALIKSREVQCPRCETVFTVAKEGISECPNSECDWYTVQHVYGQSIANHYAWYGRASKAFMEFYERYPSARGYGKKMVLIDQLIHGFHLDDQGRAVKSVASKLLEGNKNEVVRFLDRLSAVETTVHPELIKGWNGE